MDLCRTNSDSGEFHPTWLQIINFHYFFPCIPNTYFRPVLPSACWWQEIVLSQVCYLKLVCSLWTWLLLLLCTLSHLTERCTTLIPHIYAMCADEFSLLALHFFRALESWTFISLISPVWSSEVLKVSEEQERWLILLKISVTKGRLVLQNLFSFFLTVSPKCHLYNYTKTYFNSPSAERHWKKGIKRQQWLLGKKSQ